MACHEDGQNCSEMHGPCSDNAARADNVKVRFGCQSAICGGPNRQFFINKIGFWAAKVHKFCKLKEAFSQKMMKNFMECGKAGGKNSMCCCMQWRN